jgi:hypothetical protein
MNERFQKIFLEAHQAGMAAGNGHNPTPMVVQQHTNMLNDNSPVEQEWAVPDGVCGFAWVVLKPANNAFAKWLVANGYARKDSYYGGVRLSVSYFNQSMERKEKYARAFAAVINKYNEELKLKYAYPMSRMD